MDYIPFDSPGEAVMYALRNDYSVERAPRLDTPILIGIVAFSGLIAGDKEFLLVRVDTHYEWIPR